MKPIFYTTLLSLLFSISLSAQNDAFITKWKTTANYESITIPTFSGETYNYDVDWGDGSSSTGNTSSVAHSYTNPGTHTIKITGDFPRIYFGQNRNYKDKIIEVSQWGTQVWSSMERAFEGCSNLKVTASDAPDLSQVRSMAYMLSFTSKFNTAIGHWDVSGVTNMSGLFYSASSFNQDLSNWDVSNVTNMYSMFNRATAFNQDLSNWDVSKVTDMSIMFSHATAFNGDISNWDVSSVTNIRRMFSNATVFNRDLSNWDVSSVTIMDSMFAYAHAFDQDLSNWDVSKVTYIEFMFGDVTLSTAHYDAMLSAWSKKTVQQGLTFHGGNSKYCTNGEAGRNKLLGRKGWKITDGGKDTTANCAQTAFITKWQTTTANESITIPTASGETYNYDVDWGDGSSSTGQTGNATHTYGTAGTYTVSITGDFPQIYFNNSGDKAKIVEITQWGTQAWSSMEKAFWGCSNLNVTATDAPNLSQVRSMFAMFASATAFNGDLSSWDVSSVTDMGYMFYGAAAFNKDLSNWNVSNVNNMSIMFSGVTLSTAHYDAMLSAWSRQAVQPNVTFHGGGSKYCTNGEAGRTKLTSAPNNWSITDAGKDSAANCATLSVVAHDAAPWQLSPNPTNGVLHISGTMLVEKATVYTLTGQQLLRVSGNNVLSLESLHSGMYLVKLENKDNAQVFKIIKE